MNAGAQRYPTADNPTSTACGLGQLLLGNRILYLGQDYATTDHGGPRPRQSPQTSWAGRPG
jgi:hypothetical protein